MDSSTNGMKDVDAIKIGRDAARNTLAAFRVFVLEQIADESKATQVYQEGAFMATTLARWEDAKTLSSIANDERRHHEMLKEIDQKLGREGVPPESSGPVRFSSDCIALREFINYMGRVQPNLFHIAYKPQWPGPKYCRSYIHHLVGIVENIIHAETAFLAGDIGHTEADIRRAWFHIDELEEWEVIKGKEEVINSLRGLANKLRTQKELSQEELSNVVSQVISYAVNEVTPKVADACRCDTPLPRPPSEAPKKEVVI